MPNSNTRKNESPCETDLESPIRAELFSKERLEEYAAYLATEITLSTNPKQAQPLLPRMKENGEKLLAAYLKLGQAVHDKETLSPGAEWLVDNFHIVEEQLREIRHDLPLRFYNELPKLALGDLTGYPRVYAVALALVAHTDSQLETDTIRRFILSYQKTTPLRMGELWALPIILRMVLIENLRRMSLRILHGQEKRNSADSFADELIENVRDGDLFKSLVSKIPILCTHSIQIESTFIAQLAKRLREQEPEHWPAVECLEKHLTSKESSTERIVNLDHQNQAENQITVANVITSMRLLSSLNWQEFFESVSLVDRVLETDPEGSYRHMDFPTRDRYRHIVESISKKTGTPELDVAKKVIELSKDSQTANPSDQRRAHVGYYLLNRGAWITENSFKRTIRAKTLTSTISHPELIYFGLFGFFLTVMGSIPILYSSNHGAPLSLLFLIAALIFIPVSDLVLSFANFILTHTIQPKKLPKLDLTSGIPTEGRTIVVVPCMLQNAGTIRGLLEKLEIHYLGNNDPELTFALLTDFCDGETEILPEDAEHLKMAADGIRSLNHKYRDEPLSTGTEERFFLFHRNRQWNIPEKTWMGWERKRGKLHLFNLLLRGSEDTGFAVATAPKKFLESIRFVITLDADTRLPRDAARRMIGTMLHPLNRPHIDRDLGRVTEGYGILQPRISICLESSSRSFFAKVFSGYIGIDPYTTAVSDVYQDLFNEGSYTGKGIYDVDAFEASLKDRIPENTILSHDLFEGLYARTGLLTDVELFDDYPSNYEAFAKRQHRWIRGDWQIAKWLFPHVPNARSGSDRNRLPLFARWKIFDNLRRSLVPFTTLLWFLLGWTFLPGSALFWTVSGAFIIAFPSIVYVVSGIIPGRRGTRHTLFSIRWADLKTSLLQSILYLTFLPHQAYVSMDAIVRTLYRTVVSKKKLMEWTHSAQAETQKADFTLFGWQSFILVEILLGAFVVYMLDLRFASLPSAGLILLFWINAPWIASSLRRGAKRKQSPLNDEDIHLLRQVGRRTWNYFDTFVNARGNFLPPDNYQEDPTAVVAYRTSPTNIGIYLLSLVSARDLGYTGITDFVSSVRATLTSMMKLERFEGHFFNWYDIESLQPLQPKYVSTVDSGNLAGYLIVIQQAFDEAPNFQLVDCATIEGLRDTLFILSAEIKKSFELKDPLPELTHCFDILSSPTTIRFSERAKLLKSFYQSLENVRVAISSRQDSSKNCEKSIHWLDACISQAKRAEDEIHGFAPWTRINFVAPLQAPLLEIIKTLDQTTTPRSLLIAYDHAIPVAEKAASLDAGFLEILKEARGKTLQLLDESKQLSRSFGEMFEKMNFAFLLDQERGVFLIGYNATDLRYDAAVYDLLASESRLASFVAIAKGDVPQKHWFQLGRQLVPLKGGTALISWTASMFEYLMPLLVMRTYENTLLDETYHTVLLRQIAYGKEHQVPWGVSESAYNARDLQLNYQYGPFGIPGLGLKRGLNQDLVISPYSTLLGAMVMPNAAASNLKRMIDLALLSTYGFYEAVDYTPERLPEKQSSAIIRSFMAHHQGMSLVAINNVINRNIMSTRFHNQPHVKATQLLLQERIPRDVIPVLPKAAKIEMESTHRISRNRYIRQYSDPNTPTPHLQLLSNGNYYVAISAAGGGYSKCKNQSVTRWREDPTRDHWGSFIFIKNLETNLTWSSTYQPLTQSKPEFYRVTFSEEKVDFQRRDGDISTQTEILVAPESDVEIRYLTLINHASEDRTLEMTSYLEPTLAPAANDLDHPAFSKLFIQTEFLPARNTLLATRRKRSATDAEIWAFHSVVSDGEFLANVEYETDRKNFIGRGRSIQNPAALSELTPLSNTVGATLDPILALRVRVKIAAGETLHLAFTTGLTPTREKALELSDRYHDIQAYDRESKIAWTKSQADLRHLNIDSEAAYLFQRLAEKIIYSDPALRPPTHYLAENTDMQLNLWPHGISGDLPIVVLSITDQKDLPFVRTLLRCHEYLRLKGLVYDLVILNEHGPGYFQGLQDLLQQQIRMTGAQSLINKPGGVFVLRADITPKDHRAHIQAVARISLFSDRPLKDQLSRKFPPEKNPALLSTSLRGVREKAVELPAPQLQFFNGFGGFSDDGREYVINLRPGQWTPAPWINVIGNEHDFGFQVSENGSGFTWSINSQSNRLTPWSNDPVSDPAGEVIYLRDEETGDIWTPTPLPIRDGSNYIIRHGQGYSSFEHSGNGIRSDLTLFVPKGDPVKISILKLENLTTRKRTISVTSYTEWVLGARREKSASNLLCDVDQESGAIFAQNPFANEFPDRIAFADLSEIENRTYTCSRKEFLGRNGSLTAPSSLKREYLAGKKGNGRDPCAALQSKFEIGPGESREIIFTLGQCENAEAARKLALRYRDHLTVKTAFTEVKEFWKDLVGGIQIKTPEPAMDLLINGWLIYQTLSCRFWSRTAFYQSGGAFGFRDQLQDIMALTYSVPHLARDHILRSSGRQFREGDVQHWWHPPNGHGIRTRMTDDLLWLPFVTSFYVTVTGDESILEEETPFLIAPLLTPEQEDSYTFPETSQDTATLREHCLRTIDYSLSLGEHGLPFIGTGDWNDGMNRVGEHGKGESVWLGWFLSKVIIDFLPFCKAPELKARKDRYEAHLVKLKQGLEKGGWDGDWYRRAYFDDGTPLGSAQNEECKIDSIAQTWSVLSGVGDPARSLSAMRKLEEHLVRKNSKLLLLLSPPFDKCEMDPGYIKGYVPGVRENGGQYTHAAAWAVMAQAKMGNGNTAMEWFNFLNPINHAQTTDQCEKYRIEPYVLAGDVYSDTTLDGRGGWSWYTGSAAWYYRAGLESILGFQLLGNRLRFSPCIPEAWKSFEMTFKHGNATYQIKTENPHGLSKGTLVVTQNGQLVTNGEIELSRNAEEFKIMVTLEK